MDFLRRYGAVYTICKEFGWDGTRCNPQNQEIPVLMQILMKAAEKKGSILSELKSNIEMFIIKP
eukprot:317664-Karenia_brevis.AAC.1